MKANVIGWLQIENLYDGIAKYEAPAQQTASFDFFLQLTSCENQVITPSPKVIKTATRNSGSMTILTALEVQ